MAPSQPRLDLGRETYVSLATFRRDGRAVETPVWVVGHEDHLYVFTERASWKVKRLRNDPRVTVTPCNVRGGLRGEATPGRAVVVDDDALEASVYRAFAAKYGWQMKLVNLASRLAGRIDGRAVLEVTLEGNR